MKIQIKLILLVIFLNSVILTASTDLEILTIYKDDIREPLIDCKFFVYLFLVRPFIPKKEHHDHEIISSSVRKLTEESNAEETNKSKNFLRNLNIVDVKINNITYVPKNNKYKVSLSEQEIKDFLVKIIFNYKINILSFNNNTKIIL